MGELDVECCLAFNLNELIESPAAISEDEKLVWLLESLVVEAAEVEAVEAAAAYMAPAYPLDVP